MTSEPTAKGDTAMIHPKLAAARARQLILAGVPRRSILDARLSAA